MNEYVEPSKDYKNVEFDRRRVHLLWNCCAIVRDLIMLEKKVADIEHTLENVPDNMGETLNTIQADIVALRDAIGAVEGQVADILRNLGAANTNIETLQHDVGQLDTKAQALELAIGEIEGSISDLDGRLGDAEGAISGILDDDILQWDTINSFRDITSYDNTDIASDFTPNTAAYALNDAKYTHSIFMNYGYLEVEFNKPSGINYNDLIGYLRGNTALNIHGRGIADEIECPVMADRSTNVTYIADGVRLVWDEQNSRYAVRWAGAYYDTSFTPTIRFRLYAPC